MELLVQLNAPIIIAGRLITEMRELKQRLEGIAFILKLKVANDQSCSNSCVLPPSDVVLEYNIERDRMEVRRELVHGGWSRTACHDVTHSCVHREDRRGNNGDVVAVGTLNYLSVCKEHGLNGEMLTVVIIPKPRGRLLR